MSQLRGLELDPASVQTNIVLIRVQKPSAATLARPLDEAGMRVLAAGPDTLRAVTNLMVSSEEINVALKIFESTLRKVL